MRLRILQRLPGSIGSLPPGEHYEAGSEHEVPDNIATTMKREGWAVDAPAEAPPPEPHAERLPSEDSGIRRRGRR